MSRFHLWLFFFLFFVLLTYKLCWSWRVVRQLCNVSLSAKIQYIPVVLFFAVCLLSSKRECNNRNDKRVSLRNEWKWTVIDLFLLIGRHISHIFEQSSNSSIQHVFLSNGNRTKIHYIRHRYGLRRCLGEWKKNKHISRSSNQNWSSHHEIVA